VYSVYDEARGSPDDEVIQTAFEENWITVTSDKDFGELVYRRRRPHMGVVLLRLDDLRLEARIAVMQRLLDQFADRLEGNFVVVSEQQVRFGGPPRSEADV
jgi:predicted nuclease of predicted toxin-antitoxin system